MAREPKPGPAQTRQKRRWGTAISCSSNYDLDYEMYRDNVPYRVYKYQRIPPLINHVPVKIRKTYVGMGVKSSFSPHKAPRNSHRAPGQINFQAEELHSIRGELSQIKAQVDHLLEILEHMDQQRDQISGTEKSGENRVPGNNGSSRRTTEPQQEPRGPRAHPEAGSYKESTDSEEAVKNHALDQEGSQ
ncbi:PREDICTED: RNA-binding Raly-like protein [Hipposideros armiger]|uniref:RNA-binding Raly-like protein n=1 Tax=Hipposideros armiger TaxID=186990 RepID=A0A8B7RM13_HIPAR|nr:PREDICTED: RNA-binding Raly-like protein [Hipposideros armiger]